MKLTYLPFIVRTVVEALKLHPMLNATINDEAEEIFVRKYYNIGVAVRRAGRARSCRSSRAPTTIDPRDNHDIRGLGGRPEPDGQPGGPRGRASSITNVGLIGGEMATPVVDFPETAILATMRIADRVRATIDAAAIGKILPLCLSFDHRVIDGAEAARFTSELVALLEKLGLRFPSGNLAVRKLVLCPQLN